MKWVLQCCHVRAREHRRDGVLETLVRVRHDELEPASPRPLRSRRKVSHPVPFSLVTTSIPSTSRCPSQLTAVAIMAHTLTMRPPSRHLTTSASIHR